MVVELVYTYVSEAYSERIGSSSLPHGTLVNRQTALPVLGDSKDFSMTSPRVRKVPADVIGESPPRHSESSSCPRVSVAHAGDSKTLNIFCLQNMKGVQKL